VINNGSGTAFFKDVNFYYKGIVIDGTGTEDGTFINDLLAALDLDRRYMLWDGRHLSNNIDSAGSLSPGQSYFALKIAPSRSDYIIYNIFLAAIVGLEMEIIFQNSKGKEFVIRKKFDEADCKIK
jgi:hypothetical protein